ncbi:MAG: Plug domain-containing protein, partial [Thermoanaerobaculia bacterium]
MMSTRNARILCSAALLLALVFNPLVFAQEESVSPVSESQDEEKDVPVVSEEIQVFGEWSVVPAVRILGRDELPEVPIGDGADLLRGVAGVTVGRMGGHGLEPRIRGLG